MTQLRTNQYEDNSVNDAKIKLRNNQPLRARNAGNTADISILKVNSSDLPEFQTKPQSSFMASANNDLVNYATLKAYADGLRDLKDAVRAIATTNIDLSTMPSVLDTVTLLNGDRFAVVFQTNKAENGIYIFNGAGVPATRSTDADEDAEVSQGLSFDVVEGLAYGNKRFMLTTSGTIVVGTTLLTFVKVPNGPEINVPKYETFTLNATDVSNQYLTLANEALNDSVQVFHNGLKGRHLIDYTLSLVSDVTRVTLASHYATGGADELASGDVLEIYYSTKV